MAENNLKLDAAEEKSGLFLSVRDMEEAPGQKNGDGDGTDGDGTDGEGDGDGTDGDGADGDGGDSGDDDGSDGDTSDSGSGGLLDRKD